jgi:hypothetical protein
MPLTIAAKVLSARDRDILRTLTHAVRVLSLGQVAREWWLESATAQKSARRRLEELRGEGLVQLSTVTIHQGIPLEAPLATWQPGQAPLSFHTLTTAANRRRLVHQAVPTVCITATVKAANVYGGKARRQPKPTEWTHDVYLAEVYLYMRRILPTRARSWQFEEDLPADPERKIPDAMVRDGRDKTAVEFVGKYHRAKLEAFHHYCEEEGWCYELW